MVTNGGRAHPGDSGEPIDRGTVRLSPLPLAFQWEHPAGSWKATADGLTVAAMAGTDLFIDPAGQTTKLDAGRLLAETAGDFQLSARVTVDFETRFDAGALLIFVDEGNWAKLCLEYGPGGQPMVVSVVTRGLSDDCNSLLVHGHSIWLRISRRGEAYAFHSSSDGERWELIRHFALDTAGGVSAGFLVQSPEGDGCTARFDDFKHRAELLADLRNGE